MSRYDRDRETFLMIATMAAIGALAAGLIGVAVWWDHTHPEMVAVSEDCDLEDQRNHEDDCGYWTNGTHNVVGAQPGPNYTWMWYSWVSPGTLSVAGPGWVPPRGITPPTRKVKVGSTITGRTNTGGQPGGTYGGKPAGRSTNTTVKVTGGGGRRR